MSATRSRFAWNPEIVVLGPGGPKGYYELGALFHLEKVGMLDQVNHWIGCSVGSIISLLKVSGYTTFELVLSSSSINILTDKTQLDIRTIINGFGVVDSVEIRKEIEKLITAKFGMIPTLRQLYDLTSKDFTAITTLAESPYCKMITLNHKSHPDLSCVEAVLMSSAIPGVFKRCYYEGETYIDGCFSNPYPVDLFDDGKTNILGIHLTDKKVIDDMSYLWYIDRVLHSSADIIKKSIIDNCTECVKHLELFSEPLTISGVSLSCETKGLMIQNGMEMAMNFIKTIPILRTPSPIQISSEQLTIENCHIEGVDKEDIENSIMGLKCVIGVLERYMDLISPKE